MAQQETLSWTNSKEGRCYEYKADIIKSLFGKVVAGVDQQTKRKVAIKLTNRATFLKREEKYTITAEINENPWNECQLLEELKKGQSHRGIIELIDHFNDSKTGDYCSVFEYIPEPAALIDWLKQPMYADGFNIAETKHIFRQVVDTLLFLHNANITHLDVKPENLLMDEKRNVKLCDFGLAQRVSEKIRFTGLVGTIPYMAPEVFNSWKNKDLDWDPYLADVWSGGVLLFVLLTAIPIYDQPICSDERFDIVYRGNLRQLLSGWHLLHRMDEQVVDLLKHILCPPQERYTMAQVRQHPWLSAIDP